MSDQTCGRTWDRTRDQTCDLSIGPQSTASHPTRTNHAQSIQARRTQAGCGSGHVAFRRRHAGSARGFCRAPSKPRTVPDQFAFIAAHTDPAPRGASCFPRTPIAPTRRWAHLTPRIPPFHETKLTVATAGAAIVRSTAKPTAVLPRASPRACRGRVLPGDARFARPRCRLSTQHKLERNTHPRSLASLPPPVARSSDPSRGSALNPAFVESSIVILCCRSSLSPDTCSPFCHGGLDLGIFF